MKVVSIFLFVVFSLLFSTEVLGLTRDEKREIVQTVYDKIYAATGSSELKPALILDPNQKEKIAYLTLDRYRPSPGSPLEVEFLEIRLIPKQ